MAFVLGIYTSDPNLLRCELSRLHPELEGTAAPEPMGAGWYAEENVLLQRYSARARPDRLDELGGVLESDALLVHSGPLPLGLSLEENTQPFRYRQWMFAAAGAVAAPERLRARVMDSLPEHLARAVRGSTAHELAFALFLSALRDIGRMDDGQLEAMVAAGVMGRAMRQFETHVTESGGKMPGLVTVATNNRVLVAARVGEVPLFYKLLEGSASCAPCELDGSAEAEPQVRAHLRRRTVAVATQVKDARNWIAVEPGSAVAVDRKLNLEQVGF